jgi:hypothetical protein
VVTGALLEPFQRPLLRAARAGRAEADLPGLGLAQRDDVGHGLRPLVRAEHQQVGRDAHQRDGREVGDRLVLQLGLQAGRQRVAADVRHQRRRCRWPS